ERWQADALWKEEVVICKPARAKLRLSGLRSGGQNLVDKLIHGAVSFQNGKAVVHRPSQVCIRESDSAEGSTAQYFARGRLLLSPKEKPRPRIQVSVTPAI